MNSTRSNTSHRSARRGFTIVEAVMSSLIVSVMLAAALETMGAAARARRIQANQRQSQALAQRMMSEILRARYQEPCDSALFGCEAGESLGTRSSLDDVDDYDGLNEQPPVFPTGSAGVGAFPGWQCKVSIKWADPASPSTISATETGLKMINVTVFDPQGRKTFIRGLRSQRGIFDQAVSQGRLTWVGVAVRSGSATVVDGAEVLNRAASP